MCSLPPWVRELRFSNYLSVYPSVVVANYKGETVLSPLWESLNNFFRRGKGVASGVPAGQRPPRLRLRRERGSFHLRAGLVGRGRDAKKKTFGGTAGQCKQRLSHLNSRE